MFILARAVVWATLFVGFGLVFVPARLLDRAGIARPAGYGPGQILGMALVLLGGALVIASILAFVRVGRGTPAPFDPPQHLVTSGPFRIVRNPIYVGALLSLAGAAWYYRSTALLLYAGALAIGFHLLVLIYEEPRLRRVFGGEYEAYCARVRRWLPRRP